MFRRRTPHLFREAQEAPPRPREPREVPLARVAPPALARPPHHDVLAAPEDTPGGGLVPSLDRGWAVG